jgi:hypothetical protein
MMVTPGQGGASLPTLPSEPSAPASEQASAYDREHGEGAAAGRGLDGEVGASQRSKPPLGGQPKKALDGGSGDDAAAQAAGAGENGTAAPARAVFGEPGVSIL